MPAPEFTIADIQRILEDVKDPEVPVLSVNDLGIIRNIEKKENDNGVSNWIITITPTYSGCPAMDAISSNIRMVFFANGITDFTIKQVLSPAWTTAWMSDAGKKKLSVYGIAPPHPLPAKYLAEDYTDPGPVECPLCHSTDTSLISEFGSTACKALYRCNSCREPFDYFKCH